MIQALRTVSLSEPGPKKTHNWRLTALVLAAVLCAGVAWFVVSQQSREKPLDMVANEALDAIERGDGRKLFSVLNDLERRALGLTPEKLDGLLDWYSKCVEGFEFKGEGASEWGPTREILLQTRVYRLPDGRDTQLEVNANVTPQGSTVFAVGGVVRAALFAKYREPYMDQPLVLQFWGSKKDGFAKEAQALAALGLPGLIDPHPGSKLRTWDQLRQSSESSFALKQGAQQR